MTRRYRNLVLALAGGALALALLLWWMAAQSPLQRIHQGISTKFPEIDHISSVDLTRQDRNSLIIFDTRQRSEYQVSHIRGATRVDPDIDTEQFLQQYGDRIKGKTVIFYCSVGARSTELADRMSSGLKLIGAKRILNLENGVFGWHNENRPLVSQSGQATELIHPYNGFWGRLIDRQDLIKEEPENKIGGV